jgi:signal transduction histidine kinase
VESHPGAGSTFALWLPAARVSEAGAESAEARGARADRRTPLAAARGLGEVGEALREALEPLIGAYLERLRADPLTPLARRMRRPELEDHMVSLLGDLAQSLIIIDEAGERAAELLRDGSAIQRAIAEYHGARRHAQGWSEEALRRDCQILSEEVARVLQAPTPGVPAGDADQDLTYALQVLRGLMDRVELISVGAWQHAVRRGGR